MPPAARFLDKAHGKIGKSIVACPIQTSQTSVLIGGLPAARIFDTLVGCEGRIVGGEFTVLIGGRAAARRGDPTIHGIVLGPGNLTVNIG